MVRIQGRTCTPLMMSTFLLACRFFSSLRHSITHDRTNWQRYYEVAHDKMAPYLVAIDAALRVDVSVGGSPSSSSGGGGGGGGKLPAMPPGTTPAMLPRAQRGGSAASSVELVSVLHRGPNARGKPFRARFSASGGRPALPAAPGRLAFGIH